MFSQKSRLNKNKKGGDLMFNLTVDEVKELSKKYNMIPLTIECYADMDTPISVFKRMQTEKDCFLLEVSVKTTLQRDFHL